MTKEELQDKARKYAMSVMENQLNEIAAAYLSGFKAGYIARSQGSAEAQPAKEPQPAAKRPEPKEATPEENPLPKSLAVSQTVVAKPSTAEERAKELKFFDLGLPSGTMWSAIIADEDGRYRPMPYEAASQYALPNGRQFEELFENCKVVSSMGGFFKLRSSNGTIIPIGRKGEVYRCWMKNDPSIVAENDFKGFTIDEDGMRRAFDMSSKDPYFVLVIKERQRLGKQLRGSDSLPNSARGTR